MSRQSVLTATKIAVTVLVLGFSIYFSIWKVDFAELGRSLRGANYWIALATVPVIFLSHFIRAHRWKAILETVHPHARLATLFEGIVVGYFMNNLIPRSGELARPYVTAQRDRSTRFSGLLGTIVVERFIDVLALFAIISAVLAFDDRLFQGFEAFGINADAVKRLLAPAIAIGIVIVLFAPSRAGTWIARAAARPLPERFRARVLDAFETLRRGFGAIRTPRQVALVFVETAAMYAAYMLPLYMMFFAFPGAHAAPTPFDGLKVLALTALAYAVAPTPGAFGVFHVTARIAVMKILGFGEADAVAYATVTHFVNYASILLAGGGYLAAGNLSFRSILRARAADPSGARDAGDERTA